MASVDGNHSNYSSVDWRQKYHEVADMLAETRAELDDFHHSSKELEEELESELERTEKAQLELRNKVAQAEREKDEWKSKFMSLQTTHNTTTTSLQRELDTLRQEHQVLKVQFRELEMGNDDLERNERAVVSSLADIEAKYASALEEKILLEHELLDKANIEEECQRLKDELRDANVEVIILKEQVTANRRVSLTTPFKHVSSPSAHDSLFATPPPPDLQLSDLEEIVLAKPLPMPPVNGMYEPHTKPRQSGLPAPLPRTSAFSSLSNIFQPAQRSTSISSAETGIPVTTSRNKGVQMVSEMRARVKNLEQKIHTRVPRLRMGSTSARPSDVGLPLNDPARRRKSVETNKSRKQGASKASDTSGWVLVMEDSSSPKESELSEAEKDRERRQASSPTRTSLSRPVSTTSITSTSSSHENTLTRATSVLRKPRTRHSAAGGVSSLTPSHSVMSSHPTSAFLPTLPSPHSSNTQHVPGLRRTPTLTRSLAQGKRSSLGATATSWNTDRLSTIRPPSRPTGTPTSFVSTTTSSSASAQDHDQDLSPLTSSASAMPPPSKLPASVGLSQSRIGRPNTTSSINRKMTDGSGPKLSDSVQRGNEEGKDKRRIRSGTTDSVFGFRSSLGGP